MVGRENLHRPPLTAGNVSPLRVNLSREESRASGSGVRLRISAGSLTLHTPAPHGGCFQRAKQTELNHEPDQDYADQSGEYLVGKKLIPVAEYEPAEAALARADAEYELGGNQRAPGKGPADLEARDDRGQCGRIRI